MPSQADNLIEECLNAVDELDEEFFGETDIAIKRQATTQSGVVGIVEVVDNEVNEIATGARVIRQSHDFIIHKSRYKVADVVVSPLRGDQLQRTVQGAARLYEVVPIEDLPAVSDEDADGLRWRLRTIEVAS